MLDAELFGTELNEGELDAYLMLDSLSSSLLLSPTWDFRKSVRPIFVRREGVLTGLLCLFPQLRLRFSLFLGVAAKGNHL